MRLTSLLGGRRLLKIFPSSQEGEDTKIDLEEWYGPIRWALSRCALALAVGSYLGFDPLCDAWKSIVLLICSFGTKGVAEWRALKIRSSCSCRDWGCMSCRGGAFVCGILTLASPLAAWWVLERIGNQFIRAVFGVFSATTTTCKPLDIWPNASVLRTVAYVVLVAYVSFPYEPLKAIIIIIAAVAILQRQRHCLRWFAFDKHTSLPPSSDSLVLSIGKCTTADASSQTMVATETFTPTHTEHVRILALKRLLPFPIVRQSSWCSRDSPRNNCFSEDDDSLTLWKL